MISDRDVVAVGPRSGLKYAHIRPEWADQLEALELASFPTADPVDLYDAPGLVLLAQDFPEGGFVGWDSDRLVSMGLGVRTHFDLSNPQHTISDIVPHHSSGDDPTGPWYYGTDIAVIPEYRRRGIGTELYNLRKGVCRKLNLRGILAGGVIPGYADHKHRMSADEYIDEVRTGRLVDRTLTFQLKNGFEAVCALRGYIVDPEVDDYATMLVWRNPDYQA